MELITLGGVTVGCQVAHLGYVVSGRMHVVMDDGTEGHAGPGTMRGSWATSPCVMLDFQGAAGYAKK